MDTTWALFDRTAVLAAETSTEQGGIVGFVTDLVEKLGGPGAGIAVALENLFPPIPSEVILPLAGFAASRGDMSLVSAIVWTTLGSVVGAVALYYVGALLGRDRVRRIVERLPLVKLADVDRTEAWFAKHGVKAVFFGRMIPIFRSLISIPAGLERMRLSTFLIFTTIGSLLWNSIFIFAGYGLGENWTEIQDWVGTYQNVVIVVCVLLFGWFVVNRTMRARRRAGGTPADDGFLPAVDPAPDGRTEPRGHQAPPRSGDGGAAGRVYGSRRYPDQP
ncbi:DedA family protein [Amorphoplanes nipponensis]|uniref:DedA family protein n=1 Tax=Actinoplanes nipponensis TaxID=135950 RepID=A0A919MYD4_9ACTN|nr:DedA family protein [Actinoplanes nipponensis]GIE54425.1 DedA family protein [Actinoplanes nipponensis]